MHDWINKYGSHTNQHQTVSSLQDEIRKLKAELRRVTEERDILKEAAVDSITLAPERDHRGI
jgi:transposase